MECPHPQKTRQNGVAVPIRILGYLNDIRYDFSFEAVGRNCPRQILRRIHQSLCPPKNASSPVRESRHKVRECTATKHEHHRLAKAFREKTSYVFGNKTRTSVDIDDYEIHLVLASKQSLRYVCEPPIPVFRT